jgi:hypothetical protein
MVLWCKICNALIGLREPITDWSTDRTGYCAECLQKTMETTKHHPENETAENTPLPADPASDATPDPDRER